MSIGIQDLSDELVVRITNVLARRPEYGIAIPSQRWLQRQEEKIKDLPKELSRPSNPLKRLAMKIANALDPNIVDPQAVLCRTHFNLNPFLIRRLFMVLAYEVTVHTDTLRSWPGRTAIPELSAFVGRIDSIVALWTEPRLFHEIYGLAPFDGRHVFVKSACEACCLAAVGASARALADLRAAILDRMERRNSSAGKRAKPPRLYRVVEAWIDHLRKHSEKIGRPEECRAWSEALLAELRAARPRIGSWREEQKQLHAELGTARRPVYAELRRTSTGTKITPLPARARNKRRTRSGVPVALVDRDGAKDQRRAAMLRGHNRDENIYRPDSLCGYSEVHKRQRAAYDLPTGTRPGAPKPVRMSGPSNGSPTQSFLHHFEQEMDLDTEPYDDLEDEQEFDERDYLEEERGRLKVQDWWSNRLGESQLDPGQDDARSVLSMVHPAFRPNENRIAASALPDPLRVKKDREPHANAPKDNRNRAASEWTNCTVYTVDPSTSQPDLRDVPPVPRVPSVYGNYRRLSPGSHNNSRIPSSARPVDIPEVSSTGQNGEQSIVGFPPYADPFVNNRGRPNEHTSSSSSKTKNAPLNWPAPPQGPSPSAPRKKPDPKRFLFPESEVGSRLSEHQRAYIKDRRKMKDCPPEMNPFLDGRPRTPMTPRSVGMNSTSRRSFSAHDGRRHSATPAMSAVPSLRSSYGSTIEESEVHDEANAPRPATAEDEKGWREAWGVRDDATDLDPILPDDSASNVHWTRQDRSSSVTQFGAFRGKM